MRVLRTLRPVRRGASSAALELDRSDVALLHAQPWSRIAERVAHALPDDTQFREAALLDVKSSHGGLATRLARSYPHATVTMTDPSAERVHTVERMYDEVTRDKVLRWFAPDFETFGFNRSIAFAAAAHGHEISAVSNHRSELPPSATQRELRCHATSSSMENEMLNGQPLGCLH